MNETETTETGTTELETATGGEGQPAIDQATQETGSDKPKGASEAIDDLISEEDWKKISQKRIKQIVNGQEKEFKLEDLTKSGNIQRAAYKRMEEAAKIKKERELEREKLRSNPKAFLKDSGYDPHELAERILQDYVDEISQTPEQKEMSELRKMKAEIEAKKKEEDEKKQLEISKQEEAKINAINESVILGALKEVGIPPEANITTKKMWLSTAAVVLQDFLNKGIDLQSDELASILKTKMPSVYADGFQALGAKDILSRLPKQTVEAIRSYFLEQASGNAPNPLSEPDVVRRRESVTPKSQANKIIRSLRDL